MFTFIYHLVSAQQPLIGKNEDENNFTYTLKLNPLSAIFNCINLGFEKRINENRSFQISCAYINFNDPIDVYDEYQYNKSVYKGVSATFDYRFVIQKKGNKQHIISPFIRLQYLNYNAKYTGYNYGVRMAVVEVNESSEFISTGIGVLYCKQFIFYDRLTIDLFLGPAYQFLLDKQTKREAPNGKPFLGFSDRLLGPSTLNSYIAGYGFRSGIQIGFSF
jgi:hypothetical protein